jgi:surface protein
MSDLFFGCKNLKDLDVSKWNTSNVERMSALFMDCSKLKNLDVS